MSSLKEVKQRLFDGQSGFFKKLEEYDTAIDNAISDSELKKTALPILKLFNLKEKANGYRPGVEFRKNLVKTINNLTNLLNDFDKICDCLKTESLILDAKDFDYKQEKDYEIICKNLSDAIKNSDLNQSELTKTLNEYSNSKYVTDYKTNKTQIGDTKEIKRVFDNLVKEICENDKENIFMARTKGVFSNSKLPIPDDLINKLVELNNKVSDKKLNLKNFEKICKKFNEYIINLSNSRYPQPINFGPNSEYGKLIEALKEIINNLSDKNRNILFVESLRKKVVDYINKRFSFNGREL